MTKINASICPKCLDLIFSRSRHDFHYCSCGEIFIDGGFDYMRGGWKTEPPYHAAYEVEQSKDELYKDYALMKDQFGIIKDWKLSILDFFNVEDDRHLTALKMYVNDQIWPSEFPSQHLMFPGGWFGQLISKMINQIQKEQKD